jgi:hypothetical protein
VETKDLPLEVQPFIGDDEGATDVDAKVEFVRDEMGAATGLVLHQGGTDLKGSKK